MPKIKCWVNFKYFWKGIESPCKLDKLEKKNQAEKQIGGDDGFTNTCGYTVSWWDVLFMNCIQREHDRAFKRNSSFLALTLERK